MVTVRASAFRSTTLSIAFIERNWSWLSAMWLKQWRVPSTFSLLCLRTNSCTASTEPAENTRSVPYSTFPAQLWSFSSAAQAVSLERNGLAIAAEQILRKVLLFMAVLRKSCTLSGPEIPDAPDFIPVSPHMPVAPLFTRLRKLLATCRAAQGIPLQKEKVGVMSVNEC